MNPALIAELFSLVGPALDALAKLQTLFAQPGGATDDQLNALIADVKTKNATIQAS